MKVSETTEQPSLTNYIEQPSLTNYIERFTFSTAALTVTCSIPV